MSDSKNLLRQGNPSDYLPRQKQPYFRCYYGNPKINITDSVKKANYDERADLMTELVLTCRDGEALMSFMQRGGTIEFIGGDLDESGRVNYTTLFKGPIVFIKSDYQKNGKINAVVSCLMRNESASNTTVLSFSYPDISSSARPFVLEHLKEKYGFDFVEQETSDERVYPTNSGLAPKSSTGLSTSVQVLAYPKYDFTQASIPPSFTPEQRAAFQNFLNDSENPVSAHDITITYTEIVKGIAEENGWVYDDETIKINKDLERDEKMLPNLASPVTQDSQSDWSFLMKLSRVLDCKCWLEYRGQDHVLYFKDMRGMRDDSFVTVGASGLRVEERRFTFFFPRRGQDVYISDDGRYNPETSGIKLFSDPFVRRENGLKYNYKAGGGMVQLRDVTVIEDIGMMNAITPESSDSVGEDQGIEYRTIVTLPTPFIKYDPADVNARELLQSGQDVEVVNQDGETYVRVPEVNILRLGPKKDILVVANSTGVHQTFTEETDGALILARDYTVEINREAVKNMSDLEADEMARRIAENNALLGSEFIRYLNFIPLPLEKEVRQRPFDWRGVRISATIDGNVNVKSQRFYQVVGIVRHGSDVDNEPFYLRSMTHVWDVTNGFSTKLEFFK